MPGWNRGHKNENANFWDNLIFNKNDPGFMEVFQLISLIAMASNDRLNNTLKAVKSGGMKKLS